VLDREGMRRKRTEELREGRRKEKRRPQEGEGRKCCEYSRDGKKKETRKNI